MKELHHESANFGVSVGAFFAIEGTVGGQEENALSPQWQRTHLSTLRSLPTLGEAPSQGFPQNTRVTLEPCDTGTRYPDIAVDEASETYHIDFSIIEPTLSQNSRKMAVLRFLLVPR